MVPDGVVVVKGIVEPKDGIRELYTSTVGPVDVPFVVEIQTGPPGQVQVLVQLVVHRYVPVETVGQLTVGHVLCRPPWVDDIVTVTVVYTGTVDRVLKGKPDQIHTTWGKEHVTVY